MTTEVDGMTDKELNAELTTQDELVDEVLDIEEAVTEGEEGEVTEVEEPKQEAVREIPKDDTEKKRWRDAATAANGQVALLARGFKKLIEDGFTTYEDVAQEIGSDPKTVQAIIEGRGVANPYDAQVKRFNEQFERVKGFLVRQMGSPEAVQERLQAFEWAVKNNEDLMDGFITTSDDSLIDFVFGADSEVVEDFKAAKDVRKLRKRVSELEAMFEGKNPTTNSQPKAKPAPVGGLSALPKTNGKPRDPLEAMFG